MAESDSTVGSSWNRPESSGLAPMRSPAATKMVFFCCVRSSFTSVAICSAPPAGTGIFFGAILRIHDPDPAGRRLEIAVKIIDGEDPHLHRVALRARRHCQGNKAEQCGGKDRGERIFHHRTMAISIWA